MDYKCITQLSDLKAYLSGHKLFAFDIETAPDDIYRDDPGAALDPNRAHIAGISFSVSEGSAVYVPIAHKRGINVDRAELMENITNLLRNKETVKIAHNLAFESSFFYALGTVISAPVYDTMLASMLTLKSMTMFRKMADSGLKTLAAELLGADMTQYSELTSGRHFDELDPQNANTVHYACSDSDYTLRLYNLFNEWFEQNLPKHRYIVEHIESPTAVYVGAMRLNGVLVDKELMLQKQAEANDRLLRLKSDIDFITGGIDIGANAATAAFKNYLYKDLGLPVLKTTAKYQEAADDEAMILLTDWCREHRPELVQLFKLVQEYRKWGKLKSTYVDAYLEHINSATGRIHANLMQMGTDTGRFSCNKPNIQNCPRPGSDDVIGVRDFIIASLGKKLISVDLSQIELRVGAFFCRDKAMLETYHTGGDIHAKTTSVIYKIPLEQAMDKNSEDYKNRRAIAKSCNFGVFFGLFPKGLQRNLRFKAGLDVTLDECEEIIFNLKKGYPDLVCWQGTVKKEAKDNLYSETALGRRRCLPDITSLDWGKKSYAERCALNTPIQGTAADVLKLSMARIIAELPERMWLKPLLQVHDELVFEVPADKVSEAVEFIKTCMEDVPFEAFDVPIIAEASIGDRFGQMKELEA